MCKDNCKCNKCKNKFLPISGRDVLYYGLPLEIINVEYGENYEEILIKLNKLISEITTDKESSDLFFSNIGNGIGILKGINEFNQVEFKSLISDGSIDIQTDDKTITLKTIYNFKIVEDVNEANTYLSVENEGKLVYIKQTDKYYKIKNLELSDPFPTKLETPTQDGVDGPEYKVPAYLPDGSAYWRSATDFGKVDTVNNIKPDNNRNVTLKISDLEDDKGLALLSDLNNEINNRINSYNELQQSINTEKSERISADELLNSKIDTTKTELNSSFDNKISQESTERVDADTVLDNKITTERTERIDADKLKLDKPTTVGTTTSHPHVVGVDSNGNSAKLTATDFGKVDGIRVNGIKQPLATDRYVDLNQEFVKNGLGWSLKHQVDNPTFYGALGKFAVNLSNADKINTDVSKPYGAVGEYTFSVGYLNHANGNGTFVAGALNTASGQCNHIISFRSTIKEDKGLYNRAKPNNGIFSGEFNIIDSALRSIIIGGQLNTITGKYSNIDSNQANYTYENSIIGGNSNLIYEGSRNVIVGGFSNIIKKGDNTNRDSYGSVILGGEENRTQGHYNVVGGVKNHAVTVGETIFGLYSTIQNQNLSGFDHIDNSRVFNVGVGKLIGTTNFQRRDGLSVFRNGLVTTPTASNSLIDSDLKAVVTKEYLDSKISNFKLPTNWESPQQKFSGLEDKSADATYNQLLGVDSNGYAAKVGLNAVTNAMSKSTDAQKDAFRLASRKSDETYSVGQPRVDTILPPVIDNTKDYIQYVTLVGINLFVNNAQPSTSSVSIVRYKDINNQLIPEETHIIDNYQVYQTNQSILSFGIDYSLFPTGYYKVKVVHNGFENIGTSDILVTSQVTTKPIVLDSWEVYTPYDASSLIVSPTSIKKTYTTNRGNILEQQVKHFIILEEDVIKGFRINFTYKLTPAGSELGNVTWRSAINFGLGYDKPVNGTIVPEILVSFFKGVITVGTKTLNIPLINTPTVYDIDIVVKNGLATVIVNSKADGKILTNTFSFEQLNKKMYFYSTFIGSNADGASQINRTVQELLFTNTYQTF